MATAEGKKHEHHCITKQKTALDSGVSRHNIYHVYICMNNLAFY